MRKAKYISIIILSLSFSYCATKLKISEQKNENKFEKYVEYISSDSTFNKKIKSYYGDFSSCEKLNYQLNSFIKPINTNEFSIGTLSKTKMFNKIKNFEFLKESEKKEKFDLFYNFQEYYSENISNKNWNNECGIKLTFAEIKNGILPIRFELIDKKIDSRINYKSRKGIYILELNNEKKIIDREYLILSN
ncbi:hypothetical protein [Tenacibaculum finnmarkense]|uniref:hypothetical protein n=1 Tax=Tenacibaculum finnmarkense TaxID=2781243 RepID=UPI001E2C046B|nr:hypothetical protein [Tenacibaculum finnmarkense]MCD8413662.1 hypothetical protein [Tenacibaculum finnmarkense genomovar ulcerans]